MSLFAGERICWGFFFFRILFQLTQKTISQFRLYFEGGGGNVKISYDLKFNFIDKMSIRVLTPLVNVISQYIAIRMQIVISNYFMKYTNNTRASPIDQSPAHIPLGLTTRVYFAMFCCINWSFHSEEFW